MRIRLYLFPLLASVFVALLVVAPARAQAPGNDAKSLLKAMSDYVSSQKTIELTFDSDIEVITPQLEKIQFTNSGEALLSRPDKLRAHRVGGYADVVLYFDGKTASVLGKHINGYAQFDAARYRGPPDRSPEGGPRDRASGRRPSPVECVRRPRGRGPGSQAYRPRRHRWRGMRAPRLPQPRYGLAALGGSGEDAHPAQNGNHQQDPEQRTAIHASRQGLESRRPAGAGCLRVRAAGRRQKT